MLTIAFLKATAERAVKTFAQALVAVLVAGPGIGLLDVDWPDAFSVAGMAALVSVLTSIGSGVLTDGSPSLSDAEKLTTPLAPLLEYHEHLPAAGVDVSGHITTPSGMVVHRSGNLGFFGGSAPVEPAGEWPTMGGAARDAR